MQPGPNILVDTDRLIGTPDETAAEEGEEQHHAVVPLQARAGHVQFVEEPVEVEEGGGELVEDEGWAVEVDEGSLENRASISKVVTRGQPIKRIHLPSSPTSSHVSRSLSTPDATPHHSQTEKAGGSNSQTQS